jgi:hypothetical protein
MINYILTTLYTASGANGIVIDTRGFPQSGTGTYTCGSNPWDNVVSSSSVANVVLLPAGTILISKKLTLAQSTHLIGQGTNATFIQAAPSFSGDMIDMGGQGYCLKNPQGVYDCTGVAIEHLTLDANPVNSLRINGVVNNYSEELSYVKDVGMINITGTGLTLGVVGGSSTTPPTGDAANSGPYSNISFSGTKGSTCASINLTNAAQTRSVTDTRGIEGMTCIGSASTGAAIYLDGPNNLIEDVFISNFADGIYVGSKAHAEGNVLSNIRGDASVTNLIHISAAKGSLSSCPKDAGATGPNNLCDLTVLAASTLGTTLVKDDQQDSSLPVATDQTLGMYVIGEIIPNAGVSRQTTSLSLPTWLVGVKAPTGSCTVGTIFSCNNATACSSGTKSAWLWGCDGTTPWKPIQ